MKIVKKIIIISFVLGFSSAFIKPAEEYFPDERTTKHAKKIKFAKDKTIVEKALSTALKSNRAQEAYKNYNKLLADKDPIAAKEQAAIIISTPHLNKDEQQHIALLTASRLHPFLHEKDANITMELLASDILHYAQERKQDTHDQAMYNITYKKIMQKINSNPRSKDAFKQYTELMEKYPKDENAAQKAAIEILTNSPLTEQERIFLAGTLAINFLGGYAPDKFKNLEQHFLTTSYKKTIDNPDLITEILVNIHDNEERKKLAERFATEIIKKENPEQNNWGWQEYRLLRDKQKDLLTKAYTQILANTNDPEKRKSLVEEFALYLHTINSDLNFENLNQTQKLLFKARAAILAEDLLTRADEIIITRMLKKKRNK